MKKWILRLFIVLALAGAGWAAYRFARQFDEKKATIPTASVRQGDVVIRSFTRGELRAVRSAMLVAPNLFGTVQITRLAPLGAFAREKDLVVEFDDSEVRSRLEEKELEVEQIDEQLKKAQAELEIRNNQDQVELLAARYAVRRAQLEVKRNELLSKIDAEKNELNLKEANQRLKQLESDIKSRLEQSQAELAVLRERKNKGLLELQREKQRLMQVKLLAPMDGLVAVRQTRPMGFFFRGMQLPDIREGDQVFPGTPVADVLDLSEVEVSAKVGELDRANLTDGQEALIRLDAVADKVFHGKIKSLSGTATANVWSGDPAKKFDVVFGIDMKQLLTGLGAKPEQIQRVLEAAERNRKKPITPGLPPGAGAMMMASAGGPAGGMMAMPAAGGGDAGMQGGFGERAQGGLGGERQGGERQGGERQGGQGGLAGRMMRMGGDLTEEQQTKLRAEIQKLTANRNFREMSPEERQKFGEEMRKVFERVTGKQAPQFGQRRGEGGQGGEGRQGRQSREGAEGAAGEGAPRIMFQRPGGEAGGMPAGMPMMMGASPFGQQFSEKDLEKAKLPPPPEEASDLNVLLRPGLLADIEIIVEKIPNAIHVPVQAVFDKDGKPVVYVKNGDRYDERPIKPLKRSESVMVVAEGLKPGEVVALADPTGSKSDKKQAAKKSGAMPSPGAGAAGGR